MSFPDRDTLNKVVKPTWATWDDFHAEYDPWVKDYEASPASAGQFFSGGEILPDGSTVLEAYEYEVFTASSGGNASLPYNIKLYIGHTIPRSRTDMYHLYAFDLRTDKREDLKGTRVKRRIFYRQYLNDIEFAKQRDPEEVDLWINNFRRLKPQVFRRKDHRND